MIPITKFISALTGLHVSTITSYRQSYTPVSLPHLFSNHMVLQKGKETSIWRKGQTGISFTFTSNGLIRKGKYKWTRSCRK